MVPPVLKVLTIKGLSLTVEDSTISGETGEGEDEDRRDCELTGVADISSSPEEQVNSRVTWPPQAFGEARVFLRLFGVLTFTSGGTSSIGWSSNSLTCAKAEADSFTNCLACRHLESKDCTAVCGNRPAYSLSR